MLCILSDPSSLGTPLQHRIPSLVRGKQVDDVGVGVGVAVEVEVEVEVPKERSEGTYSSQDAMV